MTIQASQEAGSTSSSKGKSHSVGIPAELSTTGLYPCKETPSITSNAVIVGLNANLP